MGERHDIEEHIYEAVGKFGILGRYMNNKESGFKNGWCTKTKK